MHFSFSLLLFYSFHSSSHHLLLSLSLSLRSLLPPSFSLFSSFLLLVSFLLNLAASLLSYTLSNLLSLVPLPYFLSISPSLPLHTLSSLINSSIISLYLSLLIVSNLSSLTTFCHFLLLLSSLFSALPTSLLLSADNLSAPQCHQPVLFQFWS